MGRSGRRKCRLWWPNDVLSQTPFTPTFLFGWFFPSSAVSIDVVVAFACDERRLSSSVARGSDIMEIIQRTNKSMPTPLQDNSKFCLLGCIEADSRSNDNLARFGNGEIKCINSTSDRCLNECSSNQRSWRCRCPRQDGISEQARLCAPEDTWITLHCDLSENNNGGAQVIPKLDHLHLNGQIVFELDLHVVSYEMPTFGGHYYSLGTHSASEAVALSCKKPRWFFNLQQSKTLLDLDTVIHAMNSAHAASKLFRHDHPEWHKQSLVFNIFHVFMWRLFAVSIASLSTLIYIILQFSYVSCSWLSHTYIGIVLARIFSNSLQNIRFRCCQFLYWPIFLQDQNIRDWSCVEFEEKAAFHKHSVWSNIFVDVLLGNIFGVALLFNVEPACIWVSNFAHDYTNNLLRIGCVWLMGNPAGFKLNTELAGVLGIISLNAIQIWSTLWISIGSLLFRLTKGLALVGMIFGVTSAAALVIDIISLVTKHVSMLHLFLSLFYSTQIQAVAALWRLFRGKKWNPLRHRLDSYDYTVEQHVVGSLLFTPILLLLPTTSVFYIFFTILHSTVCFVCIVVEAAISFIHSTPYAKIFIWLRRRKRFPSGVWFEVTLCKHSGIQAIADSDKFSGKPQNSESIILASFLHSNYLTFGEVVRPHYEHLLSAFSRLAIRSSAYGLLTGKSVRYASMPSFQHKLHWMTLPFREYWRLTHDSVYSCRDDAMYCFH